MCSIPDNEGMIVVGQAGGYVDLIIDSKEAGKFINDSYIHIRRAGYINKIVLTNAGDEIIMACEKGIFIS